MPSANSTLDLIYNQTSNLTSDLTSDITPNPTINSINNNSIHVSNSFQNDNYVENVGSTGLKLAIALANHSNSTILKGSHYDEKLGKGSRCLIYCHL